MGLFDALPPAKSGGAAKRPLEQSGLAAGDSAKMARADEPSATGPQATAAAQAAAAAAPPPRQPCVRLEAAYSEDKGSRLTMEDVAVITPEAAPELPAVRASFFGVFDGHGGANVAQHAAVHLNSAVLRAGLAEEAARLAAAVAAAAPAAGGGGAGGTHSSTSAAPQQQAGQQQGQRTQQAGAPPTHTQPSVKQCKAAIARGFQELDKQLLELCAANNWADGCTAVAAWVLGDNVFVANVGDARCVLARRPAPGASAAAVDGQQGQQAGGGAAAAAAQQQPAPQSAATPQQQQQQAPPELRAITLTREHKSIFPHERRRIEQAGSFVSADGRLAGRVEVSRAFGDRQFKKQGMSAAPDIQAFQISARDALLLLACDGFWGVFSPQDAVEFAARELWGKGNSVKQTCNRLIHEAIRERSCQDNCTVLLVLLLGRPGGGGGGAAAGCNGGALAGSGGAAAGRGGQAAS